jgi:hypothetical protein
MGLFSTEYKTYVGTTVTRLVEDEMVPQAVRAGAIKALFQDGNVPDYVMEELVASVGVRAERMYRYAEANYTHGLPSGDVYTSDQGRQEVEDTIEQIEGQQVLLKYAHYGPPNTLHMGWMKLIAEHGYNPATNELAVLSASKGKTVYLKDMVVVVPQAEFSTLAPAVLELWGTAANGGYTPERLQGATLADLSKPTPVRTSATATERHLVVTYIWQASVGNGLQEETFTIPVNEYDGVAGYFHAKYVVNGQTKYWAYKDNSGTYPVLDQVNVESPAVSGSYFPFTYFRFGKQPANTDTTSQAYLTSKRMMKYLGMDYDEVADSINENPDIGDVEQAMLTFAVPATSTNPIECRYLFDYFNNLHYTMEGDINPVLSGLFGKLRKQSVKANAIVIQDSRFKMTLSNNGISKQIVSGSIGEVGTYTSSYNEVVSLEAFVDQDTGVATYLPVRYKKHHYRRQIAPGLYEDITVNDLTMTYYVYGNYTTTGDETDAILLIPIDRSITQQYSIAEKEELYSRSLHFVFNSRVVQKIRWYQQGIFKVIMFVIAVVITIYNPPAGLAAMQLTGAALVIAAIVINIVVGIILQAAFRLFVKVFGADVAQAIAIIAIIYGGYQAIQAGSLQGTWATELLQLSNGLNAAALESRIDDLLDEQKQFNLYAEKQEDLLEAANKLLETQHVLEPITIYGEKPEDFYNRTVHFGNIGTLGITAISSYVDIALTLPKINDTLGEELNGID